MRVQEIMTEDPACCAPDTLITEVAAMMADCDCGEIPVIDEAGKPIGVITDRDIVCRVVAHDSDPQEIEVREVMSSPVITVTPSMSLEECCRLMEENQIRRVPVVDEDGAICGMVAQADVALRAGEEETAELVRDVSAPTGSASEVGRHAH